MSNFEERESEAMAPEVIEYQVKATAVEPLLGEAQRCLAWADSLSVVDNDSLVIAGETRETLILRYRVLYDLLNKPCEDAHKLHSGFVKDRDRVCKPLDNAAKLIKSKMISYEVAEQRKREIEQARLEAEAKKQAEDEALALAAELEKAGLKDEAAEVVEKPAPVQVAIAPKTTPKIGGFSYRSVWSAEVVSLSALVQAVAEGKAPIQAIQADMGFLNKQATAFKTALDYPGVKVVEKKV